MKTFLLSLVVFALIVGTLFFTGRYLINRTEELEDAAKSLPRFTASDNAIELTSDNTKFREAVLQFSSVWESARKPIHFIVGHEEADRIEDTFYELRIRYAMHDTAGYMSAREKLLKAISRLADSETFSFDTIT